MKLNRRQIALWIVRLLAVIFILVVVAVLAAGSLLALSPSVRGTLMIEEPIVNCESYSVQPREPEEYLWWLPGKTGKGFRTLSKDRHFEYWSQRANRPARVTFLINIVRFPGDGTTEHYDVPASITIERPARCP